MAIIPNIAVARKYVQITYVTDATSLPNMRRPESELKKVIGADLFAATEVRITANTPNDFDIMCQEFVANYAFYLALPDMVAQITDGGIRTPVTDNMPKAFKWEYNEKREKLSEAALMAMDDVVAYMMEHDIYEAAEGWNSSEHIFMHGRLFARYYPMQRPWATFQFLKPLIDSVERTAIHSTIGEAFYKELLGMSFYPTEADTNYTIMQYLRRAVAHLTIAKAVEQLSCRLTAEGFTVSYNKPDSPRSGEIDTDAQRLSMVRMAAEKEGMDFLSKSKKYLDTHAAADGPYASYYASPLYTNLTVVAESPNATRRGVFGL